MPLVQTRCPRCQQTLRIPSQWLWTILRCKQCGQVLRAAGTGRPQRLNYFFKRLVLLLVVVNLGLGAVVAWNEWHSPNRSVAQREQPSEPPPAPPPASLRLLPVADVTLKAGTREVIEVLVEQQGIKEPIHIQIEELPEKVTAKATTLAAAQSTAQLELAAATDAGEVEKEVRVLASAGDLKAENRFRLRIKKPPSLRVLHIEGVTIKAGESRVVEVRIARQGFDDPVQLQVEGLPDKVTVQPATIPSHETRAKLELRADADAPDGKKELRVLAIAGDLKAESRVKLTIQRPAFLRLRSPDKVTLKAGEKKIIEVAVERQGVTEPVELQVEGLPEKVMAKPKTLAPDADTAQVELAAAADAKELTKEIRLVVRAGELQAEDRIQVTIQRAATPVPPNQPPRIAGAYPRRALLIGIKNYLYASALNPGYKGEDPLGLKGLRETLIKDLKFPPDQVAELSDVAGHQPHPPLKGTVQDTISHFLQTSRPQDRILLVFVGHAVEVKDQGYLVPIEGDMQQPETLIPVEWLYEQLRQCKARQKLLLLDVAHLDPERGLARTGGGPLSAKLVEQLEKQVPEGVQIWLSCSAGQHSYEFASSGLDGSVFMRYLVTICKELGRPEERKHLEEKLGLKEGPPAPLPLVVLAPEVNAEVTKYLRDRWKAQQVPRLFGSEKPGPDPQPDDPAPVPVALKVPPNADTLADPKLVVGIVQELQLAGDSNTEISLENLPPFWAKALEPYKPDYASEEEFQASLGKYPLRKAVVEAARKLSEQQRSFRMGFVFPGNDTVFKQQILQVQEMLPKIEDNLREALEELEKVGEKRNQEPSKRWQAHYDYVRARLLAKIAWVREYNVALGRLRVKGAAPMNKENNGYMLIPQEKPQNKESKELEEQRQEILTQLIKEHPGTPWEIAARRERAAYMGLTSQEAKVQ